jgi:catechol 2,3-dioxygenase-like lactoylglutathione lyase family enzyme
VWNTGAVTAPASTTTPLALDLHHASFSVRDLAASLAFYEGVLGLTRLPRPEMRVEGVWLGVGSGQIHLITYDDELGDVGRPPARTNPAAQHVALRVQRSHGSNSMDSTSCRAVGSVGCRTPTVT